MYKISEEKINKILNYLGSRPFVEVAQLIQEMQTLEKVETPKEEVKKDK